MKDGFPGEAIHGGGRGGKRKVKENPKGWLILLQQAQNVEKVQFYQDRAALAGLSPASRQIEAE